MGPILILDKSTFQSLGYEEHIELKKHFMENLTPILAMEIVADLAKEVKGKSSEEKVQELAQKFGGSGPPLNISFQDACISSLIGNYIPMTGQIAVGHGSPTTGSDGSKGFFVDLHPINESILRWAKQSFEEEEYDVSAEWRNKTRTFSIDDFQEEINSRHIILPAVKTIEEIPDAANKLLNQISLQEVWFEWIMERLDPPPILKFQILQRWRNRQSPYFSEFAPYAYFCLKAILILHYVVRRKFIGWKSTNLLDLNYLFYLPFCQVFTSNDKLHRKLAPMLLRSNQSFIVGNKLKSDLNRLINEKKSMDEAKRRRLAFALGTYPIPATGSVITKAWETHFGPWKRGSGNRAIKLSSEEEKLAYNEAEELFEKYNNAKR